jgi:hypothetical protein
MLNPVPVFFIEDAVMLRITRRGRETLAMNRGRAKAEQMLATQPISAILADPFTQKLMDGSGIVLFSASPTPMTHDEITELLSRVDDDTFRVNLRAVYAENPDAEAVIVGGRLGDLFKQFSEWLDAHPTIVAIAKLLISLALMMLTPKAESATAQPPLIKDDK